MSKKSIWGYIPNTDAIEKIRESMIKADQEKMLENPNSPSNAELWIARLKSQGIKPNSGYYGDELLASPWSNVPQGAPGPAAPSAGLTPSKEEINAMAESIAAAKAKQDLEDKKTDSMRRESEAFTVPGQSYMPRR